MNLYVHLGDQTGTSAARDLAQRLVLWHDAMVKHVRLAGAGRAAACDDECPHAEAAVLWPAAQATFGRRARELAFLKVHGQRRRITPPRGESAGREVAL